MDSTSRSLLRRVALDGDPDAWRQLEATYGPLLRRWLGRHGMRQHDIDDVTQNVFIVVLRRIPEFEHNGRTGAFRNWQRQILANELRRFQAGEPTLARPIGLIGRCVKWARREPTVAALLGAVALVVVVGVSLVTAEWLRAERERDRAEGEAAAARAAEARATADRIAAEQARATADAARTLAEQAEASATLDRALDQCRRGELTAGLQSLARVLELTQRPASRHLERATRINIADWGGHVPRVVRVWKHPGQVARLAFSPDGRTLLTGTADGVAQFWEHATGVRLGVPLRHAAAVRSVCFSRDGTRVATGDDDRTTRVWRVPPEPTEGTPRQVRAWVEKRTGNP